MRSTRKLNSGIFSLLQLIGEKYPELLRNMDETPVAFSFPVAGIAGQQELQHYYYTLQAIYSGYDSDQPGKAGAAKACCE
jgi:hypothetical protein